MSENELRSGLMNIMGGYDPNNDAPQPANSKRKQRRQKKKQQQKQQQKQQHGGDDNGTAMSEGGATKGAKGKGQGKGKAKAKAKAKGGKKGAKGGKGGKKEPIGQAGADGSNNWSSGGFNFGGGASGGFGAGDAADAADAGEDTGVGAPADGAKVARHEEQLVTYMKEGSEEGVTYWFELMGANDTAPSTKGDARQKRRKQVDEDVGAMLYSEASQLLAADTAAWSENRGLTGRSQDKWLTQVLRKGTLTDRVAALSLLVRESPVHTIRQLDVLLGMAQKKSRREAGLAINALRELFTATLLPQDRKLRQFTKQPGLASLYRRRTKKQGGKLLEDDKRRLIVWGFEAQLKDRVGQWVNLLSSAVYDELEHHKMLAMKTVSTMLKSVPEQESACLTILVAKLGDKLRRVSSACVFQLNQVMDAHPAMKPVILRELREFMHRPGITERARYYAAICLNQMALVRGDSDLANALIEAYFSMFQHCLTSGEVETRLLAALLTGVNRAYPFSNGPDEAVNKMADQLFRVVHLGTFSTRIQALTLLFQVMSSRQATSSRYYRSLYATLFAPGLATTSKLGLFLNLIYRSMKADDNVARVQAFAKRLLQISHHMPSNFAAGALFLLGEVMRQRPEVASIVTKPETLGFDDSDGEEDFQDAKLPAGSVEVVPATEAASGSDDDSDDSSDASSSGDSDAAGGQEGSDALKAERSGALALLDSLVDNDGGDAEVAEGTAGGSGEQKTTELEGAAGAAARGEGVVRGTRYDPMKRDPAFALADQAPLWELASLARHTHPSVAKFSEKLLEEPTESLGYTGDPMRDFSLGAFLDRFVYKNPKQNLRRGRARVMQPDAPKHGRSDQAVPVNTEEFLAQDAGKVRPDDVFFYEFFKKQRDRSALKRKPKKRPRDMDDDEAEEAFAQGLAESLMQDGGVDNDVSDDAFSYSDSDGDDDGDDAGAGASGNGDASGDFSFDFGGDDSGSDSGSDADMDDESDGHAGPVGKDGQPVFASADEFADLLENGADSGVHAKQLEWVQRTNTSASKRGGGGKKGGKQGGKKGGAGRKAKRQRRR